MPVNSSQTDSKKVVRVAVDARPLSAPLSGVARVIAEVIKNFPANSHYHFTLYSQRPCHEDFTDVISRPNVEWVQGRGWSARRGGIWFNLTLPFIIRRGSFDLFWGAQQVIPPFLPTGLPVVLTYYDLVLYFFPEMMRPLARLQQRLVQSLSVRRASWIVTISQQTRDDMISKFNYPIEKSSVGLLGYTPPSRLQSSSNTTELPAAPYILAVSTLEPRKNYSTLLQAYVEYLKKESKKPYPLVIAGRRGWESREFYERLEEIQSETNLVQIYNNLSDEELEELYSNATLFCFPSLYEGFGLPLLEALCHGCQPLVSDLPGFHEIGGEIPRYLPPRDVAAWSSQLTEMVELSRQGELPPVKFPCNEWSWSRTARVHLAAFEAVRAS